jgi:hypothetical protein
MNTESQLKIIRPVLFIMLISSIVLMGFFGYMYFEGSERDIVLGTKTTISEFSEINLVNPEKVNLFSTNIFQDTGFSFKFITYTFEVI